MPIKSKAQNRWLHAAESRAELPKGTAHRWAEHTKGSIKKLPERLHSEEKKDDKEKKAFFAAFLIKCAAEGLTTVEQVAARAEEFAKAANGDGIASGIGNALAIPAVGAALGIGLPMIGGAGLGYMGGQIANKSTADDVEVMKRQAVANAYRRRAAEARANAQVREIVAKDPSKYVVL